MPGRISLSASPNPAKFGGLLEVKVTGDDDGVIWLYARGYQAGVLVYAQYVKTFDGVGTLTLGPTPRWTGGEAQVTIEAGNFFKGTRWRQEGDAIEVQVTAA